MIKVNNLHRTCYVCPTQYEGRTEDDRPVYIRYRWGVLSIRIGDIGMDTMSAIEGKEVVCLYVGNMYDGFIELKEIKELTKDVIEWTK